MIAWSSSDLDRLTELRQQGYTVKEIAEVMNRPFRNVESAIYYYRIPCAGTKARLLRRVRQ